MKKSPQMVWNHKEWRHEITFVCNEKMHFKLSKEVTWGLIVRWYTWMIYGYQEIFRVRLTTFLNDSNYPNFDLVFRLVLSYNEILNKNRPREKNSWVIVTIGKKVLKNFRKFLSEEPHIRIFIWCANSLYFDLLLNWRLGS